ncbi:hypothetical protein LC55x_1938 [Lysobacter capsici]|nr:hypothetical protein LC55x_1938 [Lysobacter capsici]
MQRYARGDGGVRLSQHPAVRARRDSRAADCARKSRDGTTAQPSRT